VTGGAKRSGQSFSAVVETAAKPFHTRIRNISQRRLPFAKSSKQ
jgi:hypothetical protein